MTLARCTVDKERAYRCPTALNDSISFDHDELRLPIRSFGCLQT